MKRGGVHHSRGRISPAGIPGLRMLTGGFCLMTRGDQRDRRRGAVTAVPAPRTPRRRPPSAREGAVLSLTSPHGSLLPGTNGSGGFLSLAASGSASSGLGLVPLARPAHMGHGRTLPSNAIRLRIRLQTSPPISGSIGFGGVSDCGAHGALDGWQSGSGLTGGGTGGKPPRVGRHRR